MTSSSRFLTIPPPNLRMAWQLLLVFFAAGFLLPARAQSPPPQNAPVVEMAGNSCLLRIVASTPGRTYFVKISTDLVHWDWLPWIDVGAGNDIGPVVNLAGTSRSYFTLVYTDDPSSDLDQDGISNIDEILTTFTSPVDADTDLDGMRDGLEWTYGFDPNVVNDWMDDADDDGRSNFTEHHENTNPHQQDGIHGYTLFSQGAGAGVSYSGNQAPGLKAGMPSYHTLTRWNIVSVAVPFVGRVEWPEVISSEIVPGAPAYHQLHFQVPPSVGRNFKYMEEHPAGEVEVYALASSKPSDVEGSGSVIGRTVWMRAPSRPVPWSVPWVSERSGNRTILDPVTSGIQFYGPENQSGSFTFPAHSIWSDPVTLVAKLDTPGPHELIRPQGGGESAGETSLTKLSLIPVELIRKNDNSAYDPNTEALGVSNYVTTDGLPQDSQFNDTCADPENFRLQARVLDPQTNSVQMKLEVIRGGSAVVTHDYTLDKKDGDFVRGRFLRLVSDTNDDAASGAGANSDPNNQTILVKLGDKIKVSYDIAPGNKVEQEIQVGRPSSEDNNEADKPWKHDIRKLRVTFHVFKNFAGTAPVKTKVEIESAIDVTNERLAQSGIILEASFDMGSGDAGKTMPQGQGIDYSNGFDAETIFGNTSLTAEETALFGHKDADDNSIDVFYVESFSQAAQSLVGARGRSYPASFSGGNALYKNNVICTSVAEVFTLPHELLHILLNAAHRPNEPNTALFRGGTTTDKRVDGTKRIGPYPDAANANVGNNDATTIRAASEILPQQ